MAAQQLNRTVNLPNFDYRNLYEHQGRCQTVLCVEGTCLPAVYSTCLGGLSDLSMHNEMSTSHKISWSQIWVGHKEAFQDKPIALSWKVSCCYALLHIYVCCIVGLFMHYLEYQKSHFSQLISAVLWSNRRHCCCSSMIEWRLWSYFDICIVNDRPWWFRFNYNSNWPLYSVFLHKFNDTKLTLL